MANTYQRSVVLQHLQAYIAADFSANGVTASAIAFSAAAEQYNFAAGSLPIAIIEPRVLGPDWGRSETQGILQTGAMTLHYVGGTGGALACGNAVISYLGLLDGFSSRVLDRRTPGASPCSTAFTPA